MKVTKNVIIAFLVCLFSCGSMSVLADSKSAGDAYKKVFGSNDADKELNKIIKDTAETTVDYVTLIGIAVCVIAFLIGATLVGSGIQRGFGISVLVASIVGAVLIGIGADGIGAFL